jgi:hypothetical protein
MFFHGYRRFTEDIDLIVTPEGQRAIHERFVGHGYVRPFRGSKHIRDCEYGVRIDLYAAGEFPGARKPQPAAFPDQNEPTVDVAGIRVMSLPRLIELKLVSGMTDGIDRLRDHADVISMIQKFHLTAEFTEELREPVRGKYVELWEAVRDSPRPEWEEIWDQ